MISCYCTVSPGKLQHTAGGTANFFDLFFPSTPLLPRTGRRPCPLGPTHSAPRFVNFPPASGAPAPPEHPPPRHIPSASGSGGAALDFFPGRPWNCPAFFPPRFVFLWTLSLSHPKPLNNTVRILPFPPENGACGRWGCRPFEKTHSSNTLSKESRIYLPKIFPFLSLPNLSSFFHPLLPLPPRFPVIFFYLQTGQLLL